VTYQEIQEQLHAIAKLRMPEWGEETPIKEKIEGLEDHLMETARARQMLEEARLIMEDSYETIADQWDQVEGWEMYLHGKPKTQVEIDEAKRQVNGELFFSRRRAIKLIRQIGHQIKRLEKDDAACSRVYTMLTGA
jgi:hypothetical protein